VLETVIYKTIEEKTIKNVPQGMKFGQRNYNPSEKYAEEHPHKPKMTVVKKDTADNLINQRKLNEKHSF
jgi:hypothetical protein